MDRNELAQLREYVDSELVSFGRSKVLQGQSKDFYEGYCKAMQDAMQVVQLYGKENKVPRDQGNQIVTTLGGFLIAAGERTLD